MPNPLLPVLAVLPVLATATPPTINAMKHHRRVLLVVASSASDLRLARQRQALAGWRDGAAGRDLTLVEVGGSQVEGAADAASTLRRTWRVPIGGFQVLLIGKDGHEALRRSEPLSADALREAIDAMPMRRAGLR